MAAIDDCVKQISRYSQKFLGEQGGMSNGYLTYISGKIDVNQTASNLSWKVAHGKDLLQSEHARTTEAFIRGVQNILNDYGFKSCTFEAEDIEWGAYYTTVKVIKEASDSFYGCGR